MLGERSEQRGLWEADRLYIDHVGRGSFYGLLASMRGQLFEDEEFAELYCADNGRDSVPPSLLSTALLLQTHDRVSDAEAKQRADFDIRWKVALGIEVEDRPFAKSTLQLFRARLILHEKVREVFERSLRFARETGYLKSRRMKVVNNDNYFCRRVASMKRLPKRSYCLTQMLPKSGRCLMMVLPKPRRHGHGRRDQHSHEDRSARSHPQPVQGGVEEGQEPDARRVRGPHGLPPKARRQASGST